MPDRLIRSPLLEGVIHGFSTRRGGVSTGRYASLNLSVNWGDDPLSVDLNRTLLATDGEFDISRLRAVRQVHGARCLIADGRSALSLAAEEADALVASEPGTAVAVLAADCVPILLSDGAGRVAVAHAGWRGTVARVAVAALRGLLSVGADLARVRVALGPSIGPCCFEVGEEVAAEFAGWAPEAVLRGEGRPRVDLRRANRRLLEEAGVDAARIDDAPPCTCCEGDRFFSFRRDGAGIGQMLSFIVAGPGQS